MSGDKCDSDTWQHHAEMISEVWCVCNCMSLLPSPRPQLAVAVGMEGLYGFFKLTVLPSSSATSTRFWLSWLLMRRVSA